MARVNKTGAIVSFGSRTDVGNVREQNEDSLVVKPPLFVVADGMGGHAAGEIASEIAVSTISEYAPPHPDAEMLGAAVEAANRAIINAALSGEGREGMGTTCTAAMMEGEKLVIAQVGDSRAYLLHRGVLSQLTRDHSLMANMIESGEITPEEARFHPNRSVITRALGNDPTTVPDLYEINVEAGDRLLLCSDGLTAMITDAEIESIMKRTANPQRCVAQLVNEALAAGGMDNVTAIVADCEGLREVKQRKQVRRGRLSIAFIVLLLLAVLGLAAWGGFSYLHNRAFLMNVDGYVTIYRGVPGDVLGFSYSELVEQTDVAVSDLSLSAVERINNNEMTFTSLEEAQERVEGYRDEIKKRNEIKAAEEAERQAAAAQREARAAEEAYWNYLYWLAQQEAEAKEGGEEGSAEEDVYTGEDAW